MQWQYEFQFVVCTLSAVRRVTELWMMVHEGPKHVGAI